MQQDTRPLVAVVDDEESVRRALVRLLLTEDYCAEGFASGTEFLEALSTRRPDCLVLDLQMPNMSGLQLQERLLAMNRGLPVIVITAHDAAGTRDRCLGMGVRHYFRKPIDVDGLLAAVNEICRSHPHGIA